MAPCPMLCFLCLHAMTGCSRSCEGLVDREQHDWSKAYRAIALSSAPWQGI